MKGRKLFISILTGLCAFLASATLFTACGGENGGNASSSSAPVISSSEEISSEESSSEEGSDSSSESVDGGHEHEYTSQTTSATCTEKGLTTYTCSCGDSYTEEIPATGKHTWDAGKVTQEPTCMEMGVKTFTCTVCKTATYTEDVEALKHDEKTHQAKAPTCTEIGWEEYVTCERKGCDYSTYKEISATGVHTWDDGKITTEPTCTEKGVKTFTCTVCKTATYTEDIEALKHDEKTHEAKAPTCTEIGWEEYVTCEREGCDYTTYKEIPATGHDYKTYLPEHVEIGGIIYTSGYLVARCENEDCEIEDRILANYTATFVVDGETIAEIPFTVDTETITPPQVPEKKGYTGTWPTFTLGREDLVIEAIYEVNTYDVTYELNGGANHEDNPTSYTYGDKITLKAPTNGIGKSFGGWFTSDTFAASTAITEITADMAEDLTLYAQWISYAVEDAPDFEITNENGVPTMFMETSSSVERYDFKGKVTVSPNCSWKIYADEYATVGYDMKVVPLQEGNNVFYLIVYHPDGEYYTQYVVNIYRLHTYQYAYYSLGKLIESGTVEEKSAIPTVEDPMELGYTFEGWLIGEELIEGAPIAMGNTVFTANQVPIEYTITYVLSDGEITEEEYEAFTILDLPFILPGQEVINSHYTFKGWYADKTLKGDQQYMLNSLGDITYYTLLEYGTYGLIYNEDKTSVVGYEGTEIDVAIPEGVTTIEAGVFQDLVDLVRVILPSTMTDIGESAFEGCEKLVEVVNKSEEIVLVGDESYGYVSYYAFDIYNANDEYDSKLCYEDDYLLYVEDGEALVISYLGEETTLTLPYNVTGVCHFAFIGNTEITAVILPKDVGQIGAYAFAYCESLTEIELPEALFELGEGAFIGCTSLAEINVPQNVTEILDSTFYACESLTEIVIPDSVTSIGYDVFEGCESLTEMTLPFVGATKDGTENTHFSYIFGGSSYNDNSARVPTSLKKVTITGERIGDNAFYYCDSLTDVVIGDSVTSIGYQAFYDCDSLTSVVIPDSVTSIGDWAFGSCSSLTSVEIGNGVTSIGEYAFSGCSSLQYTVKDGLKYLGNPDNMYLCLIDTVTTNITTATIENGCKLIGSYAFYSCLSLTDVVIPDSVTSIGNYAFEDCDSLTSVEIGDSVTSIGEYAFRYCSSLTSVEIGESVTNIGSDAFYGCSKLTNIYVTDIAAWCNITGLSNLMSFGSYAKNLYVNNELVTELIIPDTVTEIKSYAFYNCSSLTSVEIPDSVTSIGERAFYGCSSLMIYCEAKSQPSGWSSSWNYSERPVVWDCNNNDVATDGYIYTIVDGVRYSLKDGIATVVRQSSGITEANISEEVSYKGVTYTVTSIGDDAFFGCSSLTSVEIPDSVTSIGRYAFFGCSSLTEITIPFVGATKGGTENTHFGYIFGASSSSYNDDYVPTSLKKVTVTGGERIGYRAFEDCSSLTSVIIGDSVTSIGSRAFWVCSSLTSVVIPDSVTSIGSDAFQGCSNLTSVYITDIAAWCNITFGDVYANPLCDAGVSWRARNLYVNNELITELVIPDSVTSISDRAFAYCRSLTSVEIPDSVTSIGEYAFSYCSSLTEIVIPDRVTSIGSYAFCGCSSLTEIVIPDSVTSIGSYAFEGRSSLTSVYYKGTASDWSDISIGSHNATLTSVTRYYYSEIEPALNSDGTAYDGNYWHYVDGVLTVWVYTTEE